MEVNNNYIKNVDVNFNKEIKTCAGGFKYLNEVVTFFVAILSFFNGLHGDFLHDDIFAIKNNRDVTGKNPVMELFTNDFWGKSMSDTSSHKSYRPITIITFRLNYVLCGSEPFYFHIVNVYLHALVTSLLTWTCQYTLHMSPKCSLMVGILFAVHPIHVEAVTGLVGRAELLTALFFLLSFILYTKNIHSSWKYDGNFSKTENVGIFVISMVCGTVAMLCKEQGIMVLPLCMLYDVLVCCRRGFIKCLLERKLSSESQPLIKRLTLTSFIISILVFFRLWIMNWQQPYFQHQDNPAAFSPYLVTRCLTYPYLWFYNIFLLLVPSRLCYDWQVESIPLVESFLDIRNLTTLFMFIVFILLIKNWFFNFKIEQSCHHTNVLLFVFLFSVLPFVPASHLLFKVGFVIAERTLYLPSIGYCMLIAYGVCVMYERFPKFRNHVILAYIFLIIFLLCKTWTQNQIWNSRESLFKSGVKQLPNNAKVHYNYANFLKDKDQKEDAIQEYQTAIRLYPDHASAHNNLGTLLSNTKEAVHHFERALQIFPGHQGASINLGAKKFQQGDTTESLQLLQKAMNIDPHNVEALMTLGGMMAQLNRWDEAEYLYRKAIVEKPDFAEVYYHYGAYLHLKGDIEIAIQNYQKAFFIDTHYSVALVNAARGLKQLGKLNEAESLLDRVLVHDRSPSVLDMLGLIYYQMGRMTESVNVYEEILTDNPNSTDSATHYALVLANTGDDDRAQDMLLNVLQHNPSHIEALHGLATILGKNGNHEKALVYLDRAISLQENLDDMVLLENMYFQQGNHYKDLKQYKSALKSYTKAIQLNPERSAAHVNVGAIYHLKGDFVKAREHYQEVLKLEPTNSLALQNLARLSQVKRQSKVKT